MNHGPWSPLTFIVLSSHKHCWGVGSLLICIFHSIFYFYMYWGHPKWNCDSWKWLIIWKCRKCRNWVTCPGRSTRAPVPDKLPETSRSTKSREGLRRSRPLLHVVQKPHTAPACACTNPPNRALLHPSLIILPQKFCRLIQNCPRSVMWGSAARGFCSE